MDDATPEVVALGEMMGLLDPEADGPLENVPSYRLRVAGAEGNVLINLARLGHRTAFVSAVGVDPLGRLVTRTLAEQGVGIEHVVVRPNAPTGVFFKERLNDDQRRVYYYRERSAAARLTPEDVQFDRLGSPQVFTLSGVTLGLGDGEGLAATARAALRWAAASPGCRVVFDPNLRPALWDGPRAATEFRSILPFVDVLLAGRQEMATLFPGTDPHDASRRLAGSEVEAVVLKDGADGAVVYEGDEVVRVDPYPVANVVDPVGAGDAFAAGVISGLLHGWPVREGARVGAVLGAQAVTVSGDWEGIPPGGDAARLLDQYASAFVR